MVFWYSIYIYNIYSNCVNDIQIINKLYKKYLNIIYMENNCNKRR
jgi:hypothetical protein